jgi:hypothetical protein
MARKRNTGPNYRQLTWAQLVELDFHPIEEMVRIAKTTENEVEKFKMCDTIASYCYAKPKAVEHSFTADQTVKVTIGGD